MSALPQARAGIGAIVPVAVENAEGLGRFVIICDHASNFLPEAFGSLGLDEHNLQTHIAWDPGAMGISRHLSRMLDAPLVYATISRLVIDCNRPPDAPDLIPSSSEATAIPGNADITDSERNRRITTVHEPYHRAVADLIDARLAAGHEAALVAIHSFTPRYLGVDRPWEIGIIFDRDRRLADPLIEGLKIDGLKVGVNEPYAPGDRVYTTMSRHGEGRGLPAVMIEIRNDLIQEDEEQHAWAERIGALLGSRSPRTGKSGGTVMGAAE